MAVWAYSDYESQSTDVARLDRLRLHIGEVGAAVMADVSADGKSRTSGSLTQYLQGVLIPRRQELERITGQGGRGARLGAVDFR